MTPPRTPPERGAAVALSYRTGMAAPTVVAKGYGLTAERIVEKAREAGVFVHDSPELVQLLMQVDLDDHIPAELYLAVAEVLAFVHQLEEEAAGLAPAANAGRSGESPQTSPPAETAPRAPSGAKER